MNTERFQRVKEIFEAVCESSAENRTSVLHAMCNGHDDLRAEVQLLLEHAERPAVDIDEAASRLGGVIAAATSDGPHHVPPPGQIGPYRILRLIGEGGMGVVYLAQQERPRRTVALKVIRTGFATPSLVRRFEHEAHVLGRLQHPNIAQIYDAGLAPSDGRMQPYLVMEHVDGIDLLRYASQQQLEESARVLLLIEICNAVQHAHLRGVIHRDLKPGNILVNAAGQSKVLDFGVARVTDSADSHMTTIATAHGQLVGTLAYMSPEQLRGEPDSVDTRSDVYSLGVLCFELLTGSLPYHAAEWRHPHSHLAEIEAFPPQRAMQLQGDLRTIALKAIHPARERRYQSALELAEDLRRYLDNEPISARRDSVVYVVRKQLQRYRGILAAAVAVIVATSLFAVHALNQASRHAALAQSEREARHAAQNSQRLAEKSEQHASRRRDEAQAVTAFLMAMLKMADPDITEDYDASVRTLLAEASNQVGGSFEQFPEAEAEIRGYLGRIYATLGDLDEAESHLRRAIALHDAGPAQSPEKLYALLWPFLHVELDVNDVVASVPRLRAERLGRAMVGSIDPEVAAQIATMRRTQRRQVEPAHIHTIVQEFTKSIHAQYDPAHPIWLLAADQLHLLGLSHRLSSHPAHAAAYFAGALDLYRAALTETNPRVARTLGEYTEALLEAERFDEARVVAQQSLELLQRKLPAQHWYVRVYEARVARAQLHTGDAGTALAVLHSCYQAIANARGESSPLALVLLADIIRHHDARGQPNDARQARFLYAKGHAKAATHGTFNQTVLALNGDFKDVATSLQSLEKTFAARNNQQTAEALERFIALSREQIDATSPFAALLADLMIGWGGNYAPAGLSRAAKVTLLDEARRITELCPDRHGRKIGGTYWWLADYYLNHGDADAAFANATLALHHLQSSLPEHDSFIPVAQSLLAATLIKKGRLNDAFDLAFSSYKEVVKAMGHADANSLIAMGRVLDISSRLQRMAETSPTIVENLTHVLRTPPASDRCIFAAWQVVQHSALEPVLYEHAMKLVDAAGPVETLGTWGRTVCAAAHYRAGHIEKSLALLRDLMQSQNPSVTTLAFYCMASSTSNQKAQASSALDELAKRRDASNGNWHDVSEMLYQEAMRTSQSSLR